MSRQVTYLASRLVVNLHVHGSELRATAAPEEARVLYGLVYVHPGTVADFVPEIKEGGIGTSKLRILHTVRPRPRQPQYQVSKSSHISVLIKQTVMIQRSKGSRLLGRSQDDHMFSSSKVHHPSLRSTCISIFQYFIFQARMLDRQSELPSYNGRRPLVFHTQRNQSVQKFASLSLVF